MYGSPRILTAVVALLAASAALAPGDAGARSRAITGKLNASGYTVIAMASNGTAKSVVTRRGKFKLNPPADRVTLHLRKRDGSYAGPVVMYRKGSRAILGVRAGTRLGVVKVNARRGYSLVARRPGSRGIDTTRWGKLKNREPIGAGNFGRVRSTPPRIAPAGDLDADAVADALDIDDDGDLVLDEVDRHRTKRRSSRAELRTAQAEPPGPLGTFTNLWLLDGQPFTELRYRPLNLNSPTVSEADVEQSFADMQVLYVGAGDREYKSGELNCRGLTWCSPGGTGRRAAFQFDPAAAPFPACCDSDGDGLGSFDLSGSSLNVSLEPHAATGDFRTGDVLLANARCARPCTASGSRDRELAGTLGSVFATVPAIASMTDELGVVHTPPYPLPPGYMLPVVDGSDAGTDASATLTFWRPQRRAIPEEVAQGASKWIDMGGLIHFAHTLGRSTTTFCPATSYSGYEGQEITASTQQVPSDLGLMSVPLFIDSAPDRPADPNRTFSYTLNFSQCAAANGYAFNEVGNALRLVIDAELPMVEGQPINNAMSGYGFVRQ